MSCLVRASFAALLGLALAPSALGDGSPLILGKPGIDRLSGDCAAGPGQGSQTITCLKVGGKAVTLGGALSTSGSYDLTLTLSGATNVTLPTTGTLATVAGSETFANKTFSGNIGFGTAGPNYPIDVWATSAGVETVPLNLRNNSQVTGTGAALGFTAYDSNTLTGKIANVREGAGLYSLRFYAWDGAANTEHMRIAGNGTVGVQALAAATANSLCYDSTTIAGFNIFATCSSLRALKTRIEPLALPRAAFMALRPRQYISKTSGRAEIGFIAEEVAEVAPVLSTYHAGKLNGVDYAHMTAWLTQIVQQQQREIDDLRRRIR